MTVLTKPFIDKKPEKSVIPLVPESQIPSAPIPSGNGDTDTEAIRIHRRRISSATTIFLFLSAIAVMCMGILGGVAIYRLYAPTQDRLRFHGYYGIPYESETLRRSDLLKMNEDLGSSYWSLFRNSTRDVFNPLKNLLNDEFDDAVFREEFELDLDEEAYSKINVPDLKDGKGGRYMHDFKVNQSAIVDNDALRCFIMPLDRDTVLPPRNLYDLLNKMWTGYYDIDTSRVRRNMRVVLPAITDMSDISRKIAQECVGMKVYKLEKYVNGVYKRSVDSPQPCNAEFSGNKIVEFCLVNLSEVEEAEKREAK